MANQNRRTARRLAVQLLESRLAPAVFIVNTPIDTGPGSIRDAVARANALRGPDLIRFEIPSLQPGPHRITLTEGEIAITDSLTILGSPSLSPSPILPPSNFPQVIIDANHASRIFNINGPDVLSVSLQGLGLTGGRTTSAGGAVINFGENVGFFDCKLTDNRAGGHGGAVESTSAALGTISNRPTSVTFSNSLVAGNGATDGGAVHFTGTGALSVSSSSFAENEATGKGGAIAMAHGGQVTIDSSTLNNNSAATAGGGLHYTGGPNSTPIAVVSPVVVRNSTFSGNSARVNGGGIALASFGHNTLLIANSTITRNSAGVNSPVLTSSGGGIYVAGASNTAGVGRISVVSSVVSGNQSIFGPDVFTPGILSAAYSALGSLSGIATYMNRGHNLRVGIDLRLGALQDNGGPMLTHMPAADSPLINRGSNPYQLRFDQRGRGFFRVVGGLTDIGAVERGLTRSAILSPGRNAAIEPRNG